MGLALKLQEEKANAIIDHAIHFAEEIEPKLVESAKKGFSAYRIDLENREDQHILKSEAFLENIALLLDGCKASIDKEERTNLIFKNKYFKYYLIISWK